MEQRRRLAALGLASLLASGLVGLACRPAGAEADLAASELAARIEAGDPPLLLDVRSPEEFAAGHVPGAQNVPQDALEERLPELCLERAREVVVYCERGPRAARAAAALAAAGCSAVRNLDGHMTAWRAAGLPVQR
jgi:rhodanese-related sulfurtransferase